MRFEEYNVTLHMRNESKCRGGGVRRICMLIGHRLSPFSKELSLRCGGVDLLLSLSFLFTRHFFGFRFCLSVPLFPYRTLPHISFVAHSHRETGLKIEEWPLLTTLLFSFAIVLLVVYYSSKYGHSFHRCTRILVTLTGDRVHKMKRLQLAFRAQILTEKRDSNPKNYRC